MLGVGGLAHADVLVSTMGALSDSLDSGGFGICLNGYDKGQAFTTGPLSGVYILTGVEFYFQSGSSLTGVAVSVWTADNEGLPETSVGSLTYPGELDLAEDSSVELTTPGIRLAADTTYIVVIDSTETAVGCTRRTDWDQEDAGGAIGWTIADDDISRAVDATGRDAWVTTGVRATVIRVNGTSEAALGGNLDQSAYGYHSLGEYDQAQAFTTGADVGGYTLRSVEIVLFSASDTAFPGTVSIWTEKAGGRPGTSLGTLTNPDALDPLGECKRLPCPEAAYAFTSSAGIDLLPSRTYFVVVDADATGETRVNLVGTGSSREEPGGARYWRIADGSLQRDRASSGGWTNFIDSKRIRINGAAKPPPAGTGGTGGIWSATLTTGVVSNLVGCDEELDSFPTIAACSDAITSDQFIHAGTTYSIIGLRYDMSADRLELKIVPPLTGSAKYLTLVVDGIPLAFGDADAKEDGAVYSTRDWNNPGFSWSDGQSVSLSLEPLPELSIEAVNDNVPHGLGSASAAGVAEFQVTRSYVRSGETRDARLAFTTAVKETEVQGAPTSFDPGQPVTYLSHFALDEDDQGDPICTITFVLQPGDGYTVSSTKSEATVNVQGPGTTCMTSTAKAEVPLTASFEGFPSSHDGENAFSVRIAFSTGITASAADLRDHALTVSGGTVTSVARVNDRDDLWSVTVTPSGTADVSILLAGDRACTEAGAICTENGGTLTTGLAGLVVFVPPSEDSDPPSDPLDPSDPLTASFSGVPGEHTSERFTFGLRFSEHVAGLRYKTLRDAAFSVTNGQVTRARRQTKGSNQGWTITVEPDSHAALTVTLPAGSVETADGRGLESAVTATIAGPVGIAVADARVEEAVGAVLAFAVTLSRAASGTLTVDYATSDGTATAGSDYTAASGTLSFTAGESLKTIEVTVLDDSHDEGEETLTLRLSNASGGRLTDGKATGTIENRDPLPKAFMARFGRTAAVHVVEQVQERMEARREVGFEAQFAGRQLRPGMGREMAVEFLNRLAPSVGTNRVGAGVPHPRSVSPAANPGAFGTPGLGGGAPMGTADELLGGANPMGSMPGTDDGLNQRGHLGTGLGGRNLLTGSAFVMNHETRRGGILSFWSRGAQSQFAGREGQLSLGGRVRTTMFGADYAKGPLIAGLSLSHSRGLGGYTGVDVGEVTSSVTGLYPWLGYKVTDRITLWGVTGYGKGALRLTPGAGTALRSGLSMAMTAGGMRGELADSVVGGFGLAFKADALWVGTGIEGVDGPQGRLAATSAAVTRFRTGLEASRAYSFQRGLSLQPSLEIGVRRDGGDAENGAGVDVGGGLIVADEVTGLSADVRVRMLLVHQDQGFRDRGVSISFGYNPTPSTPLGFMAKLTPSWGGQATSGAQALWGRETMAGMPHGGVAFGSRLQAELGYGLPVGSRLVGTPRFGIGTSEHGRDYRLGYGLTLFESGAMSFELGLEGTRRESSMQGVTDHGALARLTASW